jgi:acyl-CoA thioesterase-1
MVNPWAPAGTVFPSPATLTIISPVPSLLFDCSLMLSRWFFLLACTLMAASAAHAGTILVFGDSLSAAYGLSQQQGWAALLEKRLRDEGFDHRVANASISGETTGGGANRIDGALKAHKPDIVVLELGANDGLRGQSLDLMKRNLEAMIDASRKAKARVLLVGMRLPPNYGPSYTEKFHRTYVDLAKAKKTAFVPFLFEGFGEDPKLFQSDRVHPTAEAQALMLDTVWKGLKPMLRK